MIADPLVSRSREELAAMVRGELGRMPRGDLLVAALATDEGLTEIEAAEALGCSVGQFRRRYAELLHKLRAALKLSHDNHCCA